jgi:uncharacterized protein YdeI (YjbR/CyaY-like superfamily)
MGIYNGIQTVHAKTRNDWRIWLAEDRQSEQSVWLVLYKKESNTFSVYYPEAVDDALCFG